VRIYVIFLGQTGKGVELGIGFLLGFTFQNQTYANDCDMFDDWPGEKTTNEF